MKSDVVFFIGAFVDSYLVGIVVVSCDGRKGWINRLAVDPSFRRQGIAKALIVEAEKVLRKQVFVHISHFAKKQAFKETLVKLISTLIDQRSNKGSKRSS